MNERHAVVFDLDGVLATSMPQHAASFREVLEPRGIRVDDRRVFELEGSRSPSVIRRLARDAGVVLDDDEVQRLAAEKQDVFRRRGAPELYAGAEAVVEAARSAAGHLALVTGTRRENLEAILGPLADRFDVLLAEDGYENDKPDPEPYLRAMELVGTAPEATLVIENAPFGVQSARSAGCIVWGIATTVGAGDLAGAHRVFPDHDALAEALRGLRHESDWNQST